MPGGPLLGLSKVFIVLGTNAGTESGLTLGIYGGCQY